MAELEYSFGQVSVHGTGDAEWVVPHGVTEIFLQVYQAGPGPFQIGGQPVSNPRNVSGTVPVEPGQVIYFDNGSPSVDGHTGGTSGYGNGGDGAPVGIVHPGWSNGGYPATGVESPWWAAIAGGIGGASYTFDSDGNWVSYAYSHAGPWMDWGVDPPPVEDEPRTYTPNDRLGCPPTILYRNPGGPRNGGSDVSYHELVPTGFEGGVITAGAGGGGGFGGGCSSIYAEWTCEGREASSSLGWGGGSAGSHPNFGTFFGVAGVGEGPFGTGYPGAARVTYVPVAACTTWAVGRLPFATECDDGGGTST